MKSAALYIWAFSWPVIPYFAALWLGGSKTEALLFAGLFWCVWAISYLRDRISAMEQRLSERAPRLDDTP